MRGMLALGGATVGILLIKFIIIQYKKESTGQLMV